MLRIGITYYPGEDAYTTGKNQTALTLAETLATGCEVQLVHPRDEDNSWWPSLSTTIRYGALSAMEPGSLDILIDIDGLVCPETRQKVASRTIVFLRTFLQFSEMDASVYPEMNYVPRYTQNVAEIWCWDILNPPETLHAIQTLFSCPIRRVPFVWSPFLVESVSRSCSVKETSQPWAVHVAEKNRENTSSSVLALVAIRELYQKRVISAEYLIHNMEHLKDNRFLQENIFHNIQLSNLPIQLVPKQGFHEWNGGNHVLLSHSRFKPIRLNLLYALWLGLPIIHNSPLLADLHPLLAGMSYVGNEIGGIRRAFEFLETHQAAYLEAHDVIRTRILERWGRDASVETWANVIRDITRDVDAGHKVTLVTPVTPIPIIHVAFSDMWPGFNYDVNFFTDCLRHELKGNSIEIRGVRYTADGKRPHVVIVGPYSNDWKQIPADIPKVYFSAENWPVPSDPAISLYLTPSRVEDATHLRIPTWMMFIDWFSGSRELPSPACEDNPIRLPLWFAMNPHPVGFDARPDFCAFVVSNPICAMRNETFHAMNAYKRVDSGGHLYNNIGGPLALKYAGGGCGDVSKHHFFASRRFTISFENSQAPGYITEKVLHAKMAGCVPLYWGDTDTDADFVRGSLVNLSALTRAEEVVTVLQKLEERPALCAKIASTPLLNEEKKDQAMRVLSNMCHRILHVMESSLAPLSFTPRSISQIHQTFVVNLDTRPDRWQSLLKAEPFLASLATRVPAVNGKTLVMTPLIYQLFAHNTFQWKKSVMGCSLSHISIWSKIAKSKEGTFFLVLEDDVRFQKGWIESWTAYAQDIPADADLLYLGGVLPPNKQALPHVLDKVNTHWSSIRPNTLFSMVPVPSFHFCTYSYVITRRGALKLLDFLHHSTEKAFTGIDHFLGHPMMGLRTYVATPLLTSCFQEEDATYCSARFDDLMRKDTFDSDIWNNTECFTDAELEPFRTPKHVMDVYYLSSTKEPFELYERAWLEDLFGRPIRMKPLENWVHVIPDGAWVLVQRPHSMAFRDYFAMLQERGVRFRVLHLSDEFCTDCIDFYGFSCCEAVVRNYWRKDTPNGGHILTVPLGFHHRVVSSKTFDERKWVWSFHGTGWFERATQLDALRSLTPYQCLLLPDWNHPSMLGAKDYADMLAESKFVPILRGNNLETFRLYEALEAGAIPIVIMGENDKDNPFYEWVRDTFHMATFTRDEACSAMKALLVSNGATCQCEQTDAWRRIKQEIGEKVRRLNG